ncbi:MAG: hypothetical protein ACRDVP_01455 [Acidimicrobiales bacterium]
MTMPTLETNPEHGLDEAVQAGRRLALHPLLSARPEGQRPELAELLADARPLVASQGVGLDIMRTRPGLVVVRARALQGNGTRTQCQVVRGLLGALAESCGLKVSIVESTCAGRGASACLYSMLWEKETKPTSEGPELDQAPVPDPPPSGAPMEGQALPGRPVTEAQGGPHNALQLQYPQANIAPSAPAEVAPPAIDITALAVSARPAPAARANLTTASHAGLARRNLRVLARRAWILLLAIGAGVGGGWYAGAHATTSYGAQATLVVQSGAGKTGPGSANDAVALATTYSALIPNDQSILSAAGGVLKMAPQEVAANLKVTVEAGTSLLLVDFSAANASQAIAGADAVARAVVRSGPVNPAIAAGSVAMVNLANGAHRQGTLHKEGIVIGALLGLFLGFILVLAAERADPRVDDGAALARAAGCPAARIPDDLSFPELARVLSDEGRRHGGLTVVPVMLADTGPCMDLARDLRPSWPPEGPRVFISPSFASGIVELSRGSGPTILVSHPGARQRDIARASERLSAIDRPAVWALLSKHRSATTVPHGGR